METNLLAPANQDARVQLTSWMEASVWVGMLTGAGGGHEGGMGERGGRDEEGAASPYAKRPSSQSLQPPPPLHPTVWRHLPLPDPAEG